VALGLYTAAYRILLVVTEIVIWTIEGVAFPLFSRLYGDRERTTRAFYAMTQLCSALVTPAFLALAVLAPELTRLVLGPRWTGAVPVLQVLALVGVPHAVTYLNKAVVDAAGRPDLSLRIAALTAVVNVIGFAVAVRWGMVAVAASYAVCAYLLVPPSVWSVTRVLDVEVKRYLRLFVPPAASALAMLGAIVAVRAALSDAVPGLVLVAALPAGAAAYLVMLSLTDRRLIQDALAHGRRLLAGTDAAWEAEAR
jgi:O-antigen/teichoic acid export membrane protein